MFCSGLNSCNVYNVHVTLQILYPILDDFKQIAVSYLDSNKYSNTFLSLDKETIFLKRCLEVSLHFRDHQKCSNRCKMQRFF